MKRVHGDFTRPDDDAPAGQRGQRPSFVGVCSARIFAAEPCSAMNRTRSADRPELFTLPSPERSASALSTCDVLVGRTESKCCHRCAVRLAVVLRGSPAAMPGQGERAPSERFGWVSGTASLSGGGCMWAAAGIRSSQSTHNQASLVCG